MKKRIRSLLRKLVLWAIKDDLTKFLTIDNVVSVEADVHEFGRSWAVINIDGKRVHHLKFIDLGKREAREIMGFLRQFEKTNDVNIDADPFTQSVMYEELNKIWF